ncbi:tpr domain-containing protein [Stylonychia lemnae]|uniref:Tpr domain-containing protein n=1 Tax=Stylonychia lemnae TaxID=5949 RepID=A0A078A713_STYLE|nr:tpr domain-containing protein [Stylonychia lemnae]|eukprot:CDW78029.1 tpr domain-containing protein [Stylonychia lemnae]
MRFQKLREKMIKNFSSANNPKIILEHFMENLAMYQMSGQEQMERYRVQDKPVPVFKLLTNAKDLLRYSPIRVKDLKIEQTHFSKYIELKIKVSTFKGQGFHFIAQELEEVKDEDEEINQIVSCSIYNMENTYDVRNFQEGQKFVVLDPYFRFGNDCSPFVKIEDKSKLILLQKNKSLKELIKGAIQEMTPLDLKDYGNKAFQQSDPQSAVSIYSHGITKARNALESQSNNQILVALYGNRAQCYQNLKQFELSLKDCEDALQLDPTNLKNQFRKAKALGFLDQEEESLKQLSELDENQSNQDIQEAIQEIKQRLNQKSGIYNYSNLIKTQAILKNKSDDFVREYIGPIQIGMINNKNRGVIAKSQIKKGQVILVEKAFSTNEQRQDLKFELEQTYVYLDHPGNIPLLRNTQISMLSAVKSSQWVKYLYNGSNGDLQVDLNLIKQVDTDCIEDYKISYDEMTQMVKLNQAECWPLNKYLADLKNMKKKSYKERDFDGKLSAIWPVFSFMNHDCYNNTQRFSIGDVLFVVANRDISEGEEITVQYVARNLSQAERVDLFQNAWKFTCQCDQCLKYQNIPQSLKEIMKIPHNKSLNDQQKNQKSSDMLVGYPFVLQYVIENDLNKHFLAEFHAMQQEMLAIYGLRKDVESFSKTWNYFKIHADIEDMCIIKMVSEKAFGKDSKIYQEISQSQKELFMTIFNNDKELYENYG